MGRREDMRALRRQQCAANEAGPVLPGTGRPAAVVFGAREDREVQASRVRSGITSRSSKPSRDWPVSASSIQNSRSDQFCGQAFLHLAAWNVDGSQLAPHFITTSHTLVLLDLPPGPSTSRVTTYSPAPGKVCSGCCSAETVPSPKSHLRDVTCP